MGYEIWSEGYVVTGQSAGARYHGSQEASSFKEACDIFFKGDNYYDPKDCTYWGCRISDNESDARKSFS